MYKLLIKTSMARAAIALRWTSLRRGDVVVLLAHRASVADVASLLSRLSDSFDFASPSDLTTVWDQRTSGQRPKIVLTFDDGLACHLGVAEYLAGRGIGAVFFVIPGFTDSADPLEFYATRVAPSLDLPTELDEIAPLTRRQYVEIANQGHVIGSHTMTHALSASMSERDLRYEICDSKRVLEDIIQRPVTMFAGPFSTELLCKRSLVMIRSTYEHHFTTFPNRTCGSEGLHFRSNLEPWWPVELQEYVLRMLALETWRYRHRRDHLLQLMSDA